MSQQKINCDYCGKLLKINGLFRHLNAKHPRDPINEDSEVESASAFYGDKLKYGFELME